MENSTLGTAVSQRPAAAMPRSASGPASEPARLHSWGCTDAGRVGAATTPISQLASFLPFLFCLFV